MSLAEQSRLLAVLKRMSWHKAVRCATNDRYEDRCVDDRGPEDIGVYGTFSAGPLSEACHGGYCSASAARANGGSSGAGAAFYGQTGTSL